MTSPVDLPQFEHTSDLSYTSDEKIITLGMLIKDAHDANDPELAAIYREQIELLRQEQTGTTDFLTKARETAKKAGFGAGVLTVIGLFASGVYALGEYHSNQDDLRREIATNGAKDDGFEVVSYTPHDYAHDELTLSPAENCTVTTSNWDYDVDTRDVLTYTFDVEEGEVQVRTAEELMARYAAELCQTTVN